MKSYNLPINKLQEIRLRNCSHANYVVSFSVQKLRSSVTLPTNMPFAKRNIVVSSARECIARATRWWPTFTRTTSRDPAKWKWRTLNCSISSIPRSESKRMTPRHASTVLAPTTTTLTITWTTLATKVAATLTTVICNSSILDTTWHETSTTIIYTIWKAHESRKAPIRRLHFHLPHSHTRTLHCIKHTFPNGTADLHRFDCVNCARHRLTLLDHWPWLTTIYLFTYLHTYIHA